MQCVYRFIDQQDGLVKYIGIVFGKNRSLKQRTAEHLRYDKWCNKKSWIVEYLEVSNRSEAESLESHFISLYQTGKYYNKAKNDWGINKIISTSELHWKTFCEVSEKNIRCVFDECNEHSTRFRRIGLSVTYGSNGGFKECDVFGESDPNGIIHMNDGSIIPSENIGKIYCPQYIYEGAGIDTNLIAQGNYRDRKLPNIDIITYVGKDDIQIVKNRMMNIAFQYQIHERDCAKSRYEKSYDIYLRREQYVKEFQQLISREAELL